jgi:hypothetical protein
MYFSVLDYRISLAFSDFLLAGERKMERGHNSDMAQERRNIDHGTSRFHYLVYRVVRLRKEHPV